jgi:hypothetical protein
MDEQTEAAAVNPADLPPLTNWAKEPKLTELKQDLEDALPIHQKQVTKIDAWLDNLHVRNGAKPKPVKGRSSIQPKLIRKQAEWRYPALSEPFLSTDDLFNVSPTTWEDRDAARRNQLVLNHQFNTKINKVRFVDEYVRTLVDEGTVTVYLGWCYDAEEYQAEEPVVEFVVNPEYAPMHEHLAKLKSESPSEYATDVPQELKDAHDLTIERGEPIAPVITGMQMVNKKRIKKNQPEPEVCDYRTTVIDPTCMGDIEKAGFVIRWFQSCKADLRKYPNRYKNLDAINIEANSILGASDASVASADKAPGTFNFKDEPRKKFWVHQYWGLWDIHGTGKLVPFVAEWVGDVMIRMEEAPVPEAGLPFISEQYLPVRKGTHGEPDGELLEDNQKVIGAVTRGMIDLMGRSANAQTGVRKDMLDATNKRKFQNGEDYEYNGGIDPRVGVYQHQYPEIPNSAPLMVQLQTAEAESLTGVRSWGNTNSDKQLGDVATAWRGALDAASKRELSILRRASNGIVALGRKLIAMNAELLSDEELIRITNEGGGETFELVKRDDLPGHFDLKLSISTAEEDNNKAEQLAFLFQTIGPNGDPAMTRMILADIARLRKMPDLAHKIETYQPQVDPKAEALAQLEIARIEAEVAEIRAKTQKLLMDAGLVQAKANTEAAKAANLNSDTDLKNLDFVEQESGVTQERELQQHGAQAQAQTQLALTQHALDRDLEREKHQVDLLKEYLKLRAEKTEKK